jgi:hypothetical protein
MRSSSFAIVTTVVLIGAALGCAGGVGAKKPSASTTASAASTTNTVPASPPSLTLASATFGSMTRSGHAAAGDQIVITFSAPVTLGAAASPASDFVLPVSGNSFGAGATIAASATASQVVITLGASPNLRISGTFDVASVGSGDPSGIDLPKAATGNITGAKGNLPVSGPVDLGGSLTQGWAAASSMQVARADHTATLLPDGRILVVGGLTANANYVTTSEVYDPVANAFTLTQTLGGANGDMLVDVMFNGTPGTIAVARTDHTATLLADGTVLIAGGFGFETLDPNNATQPTPLQATLATAHIFTPSTNTFAQTTGNLNTARSHAAATLLPDGTVLIEGGLQDATSTALSSAEIYDPLTGTFTTTSTSLHAERFDGIAAFDETLDQVIYSGGTLFVTPSSATTPTLTLSGGAETWDVKSAAFTQPSSQPLQNLRWQASAQDASGDTFIVGGNGVAAVTSVVTVYSGGSFTDVGGLVTPRARARAATLGGSVIVVAGGTDLSGKPGSELSSVEIVNAQSKKVEPAPSMANARNTFTLTPTLQGTIVAIGGFNGDNGQSAASLGGTPVGMAEVYSQP